jgi:ubiquinone/menaquinone biosynthesis C-methylase UbiE
MTEPAPNPNPPNFAQLYERSLVGPLFRPFAEVIIESVGLGPADRVLDVACGTGIVARLAKERVGSRGQVVGVDKSPLMLGVAREVAPEIEWREGDAAALPLAAGETFDRVFCQQGLQFMPDRALAVREMRRALAPGGRLAVSTWRPLRDSPCFLALAGVAERRLGPIVDQRHSFGDGNALGALLIEAGFQQVRVETVSRIIRFEDASSFVRLNAMALVGMSAAGTSMTEADRPTAADAIAGQSGEAIAPFVRGGGLEFELGSNLATASA